MRLSTAADATRSAPGDHRRGAGGGHTALRHGPRVRPRRARARPQRGAARPSPAPRRAAEPARIVTKGGMARAGRPGCPRARANDARRLRGEPRSAGRTADRRLPAACPRSAHAVADERARARPAARRRPGAQRGLCNVTEAARRGARAARVAGPGGAQPGRRRALRGGVVERCGRRDRLMAHRRWAGRARRRPRAQSALAEIAAAHGATPAEVALAWLRPSRRGRRSRARPGPRPHASARGPPRSAGRGRARARPGARRRRPRARPQRDAERDRPRHGHPGRRQDRRGRDYADRGYLRLSRDKRGGTLRERRRRRSTRARGGRPAGRARQHLPHARLAQPRIEVAARHGLPTRCVWLTHRLPRRRSTSSSGCSSARPAAGPEELREPGAASPASPPMGSCARARTGAAEAGRGDDADRAGGVRPRPTRGAGPGVFVAARPRSEDGA